MYAASTCHRVEGIRIADSAFISHHHEKTPSAGPFTRAVVAKAQLITSRSNNNIDAFPFSINLSSPASSATAPCPLGLLRCHSREAAAKLASTVADPTQIVAANQSH